jgi:hypothetical protein
MLEVGFFDCLAREEGETGLDARTHLVFAWNHRLPRQKSDQTSVETFAYDGTTKSQFRALLTPLQRVVAVLTVAKEGVYLHSYCWG